MRKDAHVFVQNWKRKCQMCRCWVSATGRRWELCHAIPVIPTDNFRNYPWLSFFYYFSRYRMDYNWKVCECLSTERYLYFLWLRIGYGLFNFFNTMGMLRSSQKATSRKPSSSWPNFAFHCTFLSYPTVVGGGLIIKCVKCQCVKHHILLENWVVDANVSEVVVISALVKYVHGSIFCDPSTDPTRTTHDDVKTWILQIQVLTPSSFSK